MGGTSCTADHFGLTDGSSPAMYCDRHTQEHVDSPPESRFNREFASILIDASIAQ